MKYTTTNILGMSFKISAIYNENWLFIAANEEKSITDKSCWTWFYFVLKSHCAFFTKIAQCLHDTILLPKKLCFTYLYWKSLVSCYLLLKFYFIMSQRLNILLIFCDCFYVEINWINSEAIFNNFCWISQLT